jgi:hypothetical protein
VDEQEVRMDEREMRGKVGGWRGRGSKEATRHVRYGLQGTQKGTKIHVR